MQTNDRSGEKDLAPTDDEQTNIDEARTLLTQALTQSTAGEHGEALDSIAAATQRLGKCSVDDPRSRVYDHANAAQDFTFGGNYTVARYHIREAIQLLDAAQEGSVK